MKLRSGKGKVDLVEIEAMQMRLNLLESRLTNIEAQNVVLKE